MRCFYCESEISTYPENGICPNCGGNLPKPARQQPEESPIRVCTSCGRRSRSSFCPDCGRSLTVSQAATPQTVAPQPIMYTQTIPGRNCCPVCISTDIIQKKRGFRWGLAVVGFFLLFIFGLPLGFVGAKQIRCRCNNCGHEWKL